MSHVGERLYDELKNSDINVKYAIDKDAINIYSEINVYTLKDQLDDVDVVIVTPIFYFDNIRNELRNKFNCPIISIEDVLWKIQH